MGVGGGEQERSIKNIVHKKNELAGWSANDNETSEAAATDLMLDEKDGDSDHRRRSRTPGGMKRSLVQRSSWPR